ncbi:MAG: hypothetical protein WKG00_00480 [Polyangiaceae bacterium]
MVTRCRSTSFACLGCEASIVRADHQDHLTEPLDEFASPTDATWNEYQGPPGSM